MLNGKVLSLKELSAKIRLKRSAIYARLTYNPRRPNDYDPTFPRPIKLGVKAIGFLQSEVDAWLEQQAARRSKPTTTG